MNIQPITYNIASPSFSGRGDTPKKLADKVIQKFMDVLPNMTLSDTPAIREFKSTLNSKISHPAQNRLIMGATALTTQPLIDYYNHRVDDETRTVARNRTIAKILAGTGVGMVVRTSAYELVKNMTNLEGTGKYSKYLIPKEYIRKFTESGTSLKNYRNALSTGVAILAMLITNFALDAPLTAYLTNRFNSATEAHKNNKQKEVKGDGN